MVEVWTEKYRPQGLDEVKGQPEVISRLKAFVKSESMPNLLFAGPAGIGKTASAIAIARELFGENWSDNILELNASDERGINVIRSKVKDFARTKSVEEIPFKIIYLDEADALTKEAQQALRRTMEDYSGTTRFILSCNYSSKIISPIQSRCAVFRFKPLDKETSSKILKKIAKEEDLKLSEKAIDIIYKASEGDMRKAENMLQATASITEEIDEEAISKVISFAEPEEVEEIVKSALSGKFKKAKETLGNAMVKHGLSGLDIIKQVQKQIWKLDIDDKKKVELVKLCGDYEFRLVEGANEFIQLDALVAEFALVGDKK